MADRSSSDVPTRNLRGKSTVVPATVVLAWIASVIASNLLTSRYGELGDPCRVEPVGAYGVIVLAVSILIPVVFLLLAGDRWKWKALYAVGLALLATLFWTWMLSGSC